MNSALHAINASYVGGFKVSENKSGQKFSVNNTPITHIEKENVNDPAAGFIEKSGLRS